MTQDAISELSRGLSSYVIKLGRAPTESELIKYITEFQRARAKGRLMV